VGAREVVVPSLAETIGDDAAIADDRARAGDSAPSPPDT
jgi:hypothetical protein